MKLTKLVSPKTNLSYFLHTGITSPQIEELLTYTRDEPNSRVHATTADWQEGRGRFASQAHYDHWFAQGRHLYTLVDQASHLSGIIWFGQRPLPAQQFILPTDFDPVPYGLTLGVRLYGPARGTGLAAEFARQALTHFFKQAAYHTLEHPGLWLETGIDNQASLALNQRLGAKVLAYSGDGKKVLLIYPVIP